MGWIGALLMLVAGTGMGLYASHRLHRRVLFLEMCDRLLQMLLQEMTYTAQPLPELWQRLAQSEPFSTFSLVQDTTAYWRDIPFATAFAKAVQQAKDTGLVSPEAGEVLIAFAMGVGSTDLEGQTSHVNYHRMLLQNQLEEADRLWQEKGRMYRVLGPAAGMALALVLL